ncbi:MAG: hypothetical protein R8G66_25990 [Cytophagales bacterium]|nr:hypothetical protein [Cytophagales bacterium]
MKNLTRTFIACLFSTLLFASCSGLQEDLSEVQVLNPDVITKSNGGDGGDPELPDDGE